VSRWSKMTDTARGHDYDLRWKRLEEAGESIHGEADLVEWLLGGCSGRTVLDAGCGTGRVAIELARRGADVVGVDLDSAMLAAAREKAPGLRWVHGDLSHVDVSAGVAVSASRKDGSGSGRRDDSASECGEAGIGDPQQTIGPKPAVSSRGFDLVVMAGNVVIFLAPGSEPRVLANLSRMLRPGGLLAAGFQLGPGRVGVDLYDRWAEAAGLELVHRWSTWGREPFPDGRSDGSAGRSATGPAAGYAVSVHAVSVRSGPATLD